MTLDIPLAAGGLVVTTVTARGGEGSWLRLAGEADVSDVEVLRRALAGPLAAPGDVHIDVSALEFTDVAATRLLVQAAARLAPRRRLVLHEAPPMLRRLLQMCWPGQAGLEVTP